jgi:AAHS family 4-hydroxybenzoate transporter-like MFS transporter
LPVAVALAGDAVETRNKAAAAMLVATGLSAGGVIGGVLGAATLAHFGWRPIFWIGGLAPLAALPAVFLVPRGEWKPVETTAISTSRQFFENGRVGRTLSLWAFALLAFAQVYALLFWLPSFAVALGATTETAASVSAIFSLGGLIGDLALAGLALRLPIEQVLGVSVALLAACLAAFGFLDLPFSARVLLIFGMGAVGVPLCVGQSALAVSAYPVPLAAMGVGLAAAAGRVGSLLGPAVAGALLGLGFGPRFIVLMGIAPVLAAGVALRGLKRAT